MLAVQSQDLPGAKWAIAQRCAPTTDDAIDALLDAGGLIRTHVMRPTWHIVLPRDLRWLLALTAPRVHRLDAARRRQLELDDALLKRCRKLIVGELRDGNARTRSELGALLERNRIATRDNRLAHILMHNELDAIICSGPRSGAHLTYVLVDERVPATPARSRDEALATIVAAYFRGHGPATVHDCAWWSGLRIGDVREGLALIGSALSSESVDGTTYWMATDAGPARASRPLVHLLPNFDEHIVAYRNHAPSLDPAIVWTRDVISDRLAPHIVAIDGLAIGGWRRVNGAHETVVELALGRRIDAREERALARAGEELAEFLGTAVRMVEGVSVARARSV